MTTTIHKTAGLLAIACALALTPDSANAAIIYNDGDLILGFRATGGQGASTNYLVDLGSASPLVTSTSPIVFSLGNIGTDLSTIFGANWFSRADVLWSVSGVQKISGNGFASNTMFATRSDSVDGPLGTNTTAPWNRPSTFAAGAPATKIQSLGLKYGQGTTGGVAGFDQMESTNAPGMGLIQPTSQGNSYDEYQPGGSQTTGVSAYGYFADLNGIEGNFASNGSGFSVLDLYTVAPGSGGASFRDSVTISNGGTLTFTPPVPEPTAAVTLALGGMVLASLRRRRATSSNR